MDGDSGARRPHDHLILVTATEAVKGVLNDGSSAQEDASAFSFCCNLLGLQDHGAKQKGRIFHRNLVVITPGLTQGGFAMLGRDSQNEFDEPHGPHEIRFQTPAMCWGQSRLPKCIIGLGKKSMLYEQQSALGKCCSVSKACIIFASGVDKRLAAIVN